MTSTQPQPDQPDDQDPPPPNGEEVPLPSGTDGDMETWTPPRGPMVKLIAWLILAMIGLGLGAMIWVIARNQF